MKQINPKSKAGLVLATLAQRDVSISQSEAKKFLGVGNLRAEAFRLRQAGYPVVARKVVTEQGSEVTEYELGTPSREVIALGYAMKTLGFTV